MNILDNILLCNNFKFYVNIWETKFMLPVLNIFHLRKCGCFNRRIYKESQIIDW